MSSSETCNPPVGTSDKITTSQARHAFLSFCQHPVCKEVVAETLLRVLNVVNSDWSREAITGHLATLTAANQPPPAKRTRTKKTYPAAQLAARTHAKAVRDHRNQWNKKGGARHEEEGQPSGTLDVNKEISAPKELSFKQERPGV